MIVTAASTGRDDRRLRDETDTARLAAAIADLARPADVIALFGELGVGKTSFARAFIERLAGSAEEVPSPTFTLVQTYDAPVATIWHLDLYRLAAPAEAYELDIEEAFAEGISLIEWPERLGSLLPADRLEVRLAFAPRRGPQGRLVRLVGYGSWQRRLRELAWHG